MASKKTSRMTIRFENGERKLVGQACDLCGLKDSDFGRKAIVAMAQAVIKNKGEMKLPVKFH